MSCQILETKDGKAILSCTTSDWAFGPIFDSLETAETFLAWMRREQLKIFGVHPEFQWLDRTDPRSYSDGNLADLYSHFLNWNVSNKLEIQ